MVKQNHSTPVPRLYKEAAKILKKVRGGEGLRDLIFSKQLHNTKGTYALVCNSIRNGRLLDYVLDESGVLNEKFDRDLARILVCELLFGKKTLPGDSKPIQTTLAFEQILKEAAEKSGIPINCKTALRPRFARINTLHKSIKFTIGSFVKDGWELLETPNSYDDFHELICNLQERQFVQDYHFIDLLVFPPKTDIHKHTLVEKGSLILQDKASYLPVHLLNPEPGSVVLDMCAAPGIKTAHLANVMNNEGTIYAIDLKKQRFEVMETQVQRYCGEDSCVKTFVDDSTEITSEQYPNVKYILVDPSCTGTGMSTRVDDLSDFTRNVNTRRVQKLANFQERILLHALLGFPDVERVVYSTCSILEEENEKIVERVLAKVDGFKVVSPHLEKPWENRGDEKYPFGPKCLVADTKKDCCNGFFVAVLERKPQENSVKKKRSKKNIEVIEEQCAKSAGISKRKSEIIEDQSAKTEGKFKRKRSKLKIQNV